MYIPTYGLAHHVVIQHECKETCIRNRYQWCMESTELPIYEKRWQMVIKKRSTIATCYRCIETEYRGFSTPRIAYNNDMKNDKEELAELDRLVKFVQDNPGAEYPIPDKIHTAQIKVWGNYCNLRCLMCSAEDSSGVGEEWIALG